MKNPPYTIHVDPNFYNDIEDVSSWIKKSNVDFGYDDEFADSKVDEFINEIQKIISDLGTSPYQGQKNDHSGVRGFPVYKGKYSIRWTVDDNNRKVSILGVKDLKHPNQLRGFNSDF